MTATLTIISDRYSGVDGSQRKYLDYTVSMTNPYTAGGEVLTTFSGVMQQQWLGGWVTGVAQAVTSTGLRGIGRTATFLGDTTSTATVIMQMFSNGLSATGAAGQFVDNTVANLSTLTFTVRVAGR